jgi:hypothetical protein
VVGEFQGVWCNSKFFRQLILGEGVKMNAARTVGTIVEPVAETGPNMVQPPYPTQEGRRPEINQRTMKFIVGAIAIGLPIAIALLTGMAVGSISESYWYGDPSLPMTARSVFVGCLFAIASFLFAYNGEDSKETLPSKIAGFSALGVALDPCDCDKHAHALSGFHFAFAAAMFGILAWFCWHFRQRALAKLLKDGNSKAGRRANIYLTCFVAMMIAILVMGVRLAKRDWFGDWPDVIFCMEALGLFAFGLSWSTASLVWPFITERQERHSLVPNRCTGVFEKRKSFYGSIE